MKAQRVRDRGKGRKKLVFLCVCAVLLCLILPGLNNGLTAAVYHLAADGASAPVRIAFVSDLHSCAYGTDMRELIDEIDRQTPDLILLGGDVFDSSLPDDNAIAFLQGVAGRYPCYYVTGNHEYLTGAERFSQRMAAMEALGVVRLSGAMAQVEAGGLRLNICGVDDPRAWTDAFDPAASAFPSFREQLQAVSALPREGGYTVLLTHRPELFDLYCSYGCDLVLAGHAHGGQWRLPWLLNGLYAPNQGLFPAYAGGRYEKDGTVMIVGRGLARESTRVPRLYNRPELVIVELSSGEQAAINN